MNIYVTYKTGPLGLREVDRVWMTRSGAIKTLMAEMFKEELFPNYEEKELEALVERRVYEVEAEPCRLVNIGEIFYD